MSKRPDPKNYTKWEKPLPFNLEDFMNQYIAWKIDGVEHPEWKQKVVLKFETDLKEMIRVHWKASSKSRKLFIAMNKDDVWENEKAVDMKLTKRNLATLDPKFIPDLNKHVLDHMTELIEELRAQSRSFINAIYPSESEVADLEKKLEGSTPEDYTFENYGTHLNTAAECQQAFRHKWGVIETLRKREMFVQQLVRFEERMKEEVKKPMKGKQNVNNWLPQFRNDAAKILQKANKTAVKFIETYESESGGAFHLLGQDYRTEFLEKQLAQVARVKTNFSYMTADILFFDNPGGGAEGADVVPRHQDERIELHIASGTPEAEPPAMPTRSEELGFTFQYN